MDERQLWDQSPELRRAARGALTEWGRAERGGWPKLGYPSRSPGQPGGRPDLTYDAEVAGGVARALELWGRLSHALGEPALTRYAEYVYLLNLRYARGLKMDALRRRTGLSRRTLQRRLDQAGFAVWSLRGV